MRDFVSLYMQFLKVQSSRFGHELSNGYAYLQSISKSYRQALNESEFDEDSLGA